MEYRAEIRKVPEHVVYYKEYFIEDLNGFFCSLEENNFLQELSDRVLDENPSIQLTEPEYNVILFPEGEYHSQNVRIEFCDAVTAAGNDTEDYRFRKTESFTSLSILHKGAYREIALAYDFADRWMKENGYKKIGNPRNSAIDGFWNKESEEEYLTEIQIPVEKSMV